MCTVLEMSILTLYSVTLLVNEWLSELERSKENRGESDRSNVVNEPAEGERQCRTSLILCASIPLQATSTLDLWSW